MGKTKATAVVEEVKSSKKQKVESEVRFLTNYVYIN